MIYHCRPVISHKLMVTHYRQYLDTSSDQHSLLPLLPLQLLVVGIESAKLIQTSHSDLCIESRWVFNSQAPAFVIPMYPVCISMVRHSRVVASDDVIAF